MSQRFEQRVLHGVDVLRSLDQAARPALALTALWVLIMIGLPIAKWTIGPHVVAVGISIGVLAQVIAVVAVVRLEWGWRRIAAVFAVVTVITLVVEAIGTATGLPFGRYSYTELLQPQIAHVPLLIPLAWFMLLPPAWTVAHALRGRRLPFALLSGLAFTAWDLFLDPQMVGWGFWVWEQPGGYFGIPWINYAGWLLTSSLISWLLYPHIALHLRTTRRLLLVVYSITWYLETFGLALFWGMPGPAVVGGLVMGGLMLYGWRTLAAERRRPEEVA